MIEIIIYGAMTGAADTKTPMYIRGVLYLSRMNKRNWKYLRV
ncbi:hypothetical protein [Clostridium thermarum]|nr:hypothetical protein [Clostridium thermarum]